MTAERLIDLGTGAHAGNEHDARIAALRARMAEHGLAAIAVASPENIYYLTGLDHLGYFAFSLLLVPAHGELAVVTREMERPTIRAQLPGCRHLTFGDGEDPGEVTADALERLVEPGATVAVEESTMFFPPAIHALLRGRLPGVRWTDGTGLLVDARAIKSPGELEHIRRAAGVSDAAMRAGIGAAGVGVPEREIAASVYHAMFSAGGQQPGFVPLIRPLWILDQEHVSWGERVLDEGTGLFMELSGCVRRYHAPMSRTIYIGRAAPDAEEAHAAGMAGLEAARSALHPGALTGDVYSAWQRAVAGSEANSWPQRHHCGYLVGIGFPPSWVGGGEVLGIRPGGEVEIAAGMTFHLMSWVTQPVGHVISDTALVTETGAELLTSVPRELTVVS
ncbi:MAG: M24 family metallopeptidase [Pseudonocardiaceae bacterium]|nr:M24 family metallopeptidase [Pseudonocardiaceae bacterium]